MQPNSPIWRIDVVNSIEELGHSIVYRNYGNRRSFLLSRYYFLASFDGSCSKYAICLDEGHSDIKQIESIDFTFLNLGEAIEQIAIVLRGCYDFYSFQSLDRKQLDIVDRNLPSCWCHSLKS